MGVNMFIRASKLTRITTISRTLTFIILFVCSLGVVLRHIFKMETTHPTTTTTTTTLLPHAPGPVTPPPWQEIVEQKLRADRAKIPAAWLLEEEVVQEAISRRQIAGQFIESLLDAESLRITALDVPELVQKMGKRRVDGSCRW